MPKIHISDWKTVNLSDFPHFKCVCELCDCGCFERSGKRHSTNCKKHVPRISDAFCTTNSKFEPSLYFDSYKNIEYESPNKKNLSYKLNNYLTESGNFKATIPIVYGPKETILKLPDKDEKLSIRTTNKDHFKLWNSPPAEVVPEYPEFASKLIYPNEKRHHLTTNEELFYKNYGKFKAQTSALNIFENSFKIPQSSKMNLDSVYAQDFTKFNIKEVLKERGKPVTRSLDEIKNSSKISAKLPMDTKTQNMLDFSFNADHYKNASAFPKQRQYNDLFKSKLNKDLNPVDSNLKSNDLYNNLGESHFMHKNIHFANTFDNRLIPELKVIKQIPMKKKSNLPRSRSSDNSSRNEFDTFDLENESSTYKVDFKNNGVDVCMSKAYGIISNNTKKIFFNSLNNEQNASLVH